MDLEKEAKIPRIIYYDWDGKPMELMEWARKFEDETVTKKRQFGSTRLWFGLVWISTVWLGMDHDFSWPYWEKGPNPHPIIFESMAFIKGHGGEMRRYSTKEQALAGHKAMARHYRNPINVVREWWDNR